jgi:hypothetical protein
MKEGPELERLLIRKAESNPFSGIDPLQLKASDRRWMELSITFLPCGPNQKFVLISSLSSSTALTNLVVNFANLLCPLHF